MVDVVSIQKRSQMMSGIQSKNTRPELIVRKALHNKGFRFRTHPAGLPGKPDIVLSKYKAVIFIHGCFWHGHDCHLFKWPSSKADFWLNKINRNRDKDSEVVSALLGLDWRILVIWECSLKGKEKLGVEEVVRRASLWLKRGNLFQEFVNFLAVP